MAPVFFADRAGLVYTVFNAMGVDGQRTMLARRLLVGQVLELLLYLSVLFPLYGRYGTWAYVGGTVALAATVRAAIVGFLYLVSWLSWEPVPPSARVGILRFLGMCLREYVAFVKLYTLYHIFPGIFGRSDKAEADAERVPVLFIHGYMCNAGSWAAVLRYLRAQNIGPLYTITLEPLWANIETLAKQVAVRIEAIHAQTRAEKVILVGHSMGGVVARAYLRQNGEDRVALVITLGSPHYGTALARWLGFGRNVSQLSPDSFWLQSLNEYVPEVPMITAYSWHDELIAPQSSGRLPFAESVAWAGMGHLAMLSDRRVLSLLEEKIKTIGVAPGDALP